MEAQDKTSERHQQCLKDFKSRLESLTTQHTLSNSSRLLRAVVAQTQSSHRLSQIVQSLYLLIPAVRSSPIGPEEERLGATLEEIEDELKRGRMKGTMNELWARLSTINAAKDRARIETGEWAVVDEDGFAQLTEVRTFFYIPFLIPPGFLPYTLSPRPCCLPTITVHYDTDLISLSITDSI